MADLQDATERRFLEFLRSPWGIAVIILALFFAGEGYLALRDRGIEKALESDPAFVTPQLDLAFSKNIPYDPLNFVGKGAQAGFWNWTPQGLVLTDQGRNYFDDTGGMFVSRAPAGRRQIERIRINDGMPDGERRLEFVYKWAEVSPPAAMLLTPPPTDKDDYPGEAFMAHDDTGWKLKTLHTLDFDEPLGHLKAAASGVLK